MDIIFFLLIGLLAGWISGSLVRGRGFGILGDIVIGVIGALIGGYLFRALSITAYGFLGSLIMATLGAVVFLLLIRLVKSA